MIEHKKSEHVDSFRDFLKEVAPIRFKEPFAETLGAFKKKDAVNDKTVFVEFFPNKIPFAEEKASRLRELLEKVIWEAAKEEEKKEFQDLWMGKVKDMVLEKKEIDEWINI